MGPHRHPAQARTTFNPTERNIVLLPDMFDPLTTYSRMSGVRTNRCERRPQERMRDALAIEQRSLGDEFGPRIFRMLGRVTRDGTQASISPTA